MNDAQNTHARLLSAQIFDTTTDVLSDIMGIEPTFRDMTGEVCPNHDSEAPSPMSIPFTGTLRGDCALSANRQFAQHLLAGMGFANIPDGEMAMYASDAVSELLNIIMGNILLHLGKKGIDLDIGSPVPFDLDAATNSTRRLYVSETASGTICLAIHIREE